MSNSGVRDCIPTALSRLPTPQVDGTHVTQPNTFLSRLPIVVELRAPSKGMTRRWAVLLFGLTWQHMMDLAPFLTLDRETRKSVRCHMSLALSLALTSATFAAQTALRITDSRVPSIGTKCTFSQVTMTVSTLLWNSVWDVVKSGQRAPR